MRGGEEEKKNKGGRGQAKARREESKQRKKWKEGRFFKIIILQRYQNQKKEVKNEYKVWSMSLVSEF